LGFYNAKHLKSSFEEGWRLEGVSVLSFLLFYLGTWASHPTNFLNLLELKII